MSQTKTSNTEITSAVPTNETLNAVSQVEYVPLTPAALQYFDPETQQEILALSKRIDVRDLEKVMSYGHIPLQRSFEEAGKVLQSEEGSSADQEVIRQVLELAKLANENYEDFNLVLKKPNLLQRLLLKLSRAAKDKHDKDVAVKAITNYKLLEQLRDSCERWIDMLTDGYTKISVSALQDKENCEELEKYIIAGQIALLRLEEEVEQARQEYELSHLITDKEKWDTLKEGLDTFKIVLLNLEKSRAAFGISIGQLALQSKTNKNIQIAVRTQKANSMALAGQQLRNAVLDARNKMALEGQKSIASLNNELMKKISENSVITAEESEKILLNGVYSIEAALEAAKTVISGCELIKQARENRDSAISQELGKLKTLLDEIEPFVTRMQEETSSTSSSSSKNGHTTTKGSLSF